MEVGYQFLGTVVRVTDMAVLDGFAPEVERQGMPQESSQIEIRVDAVLMFTVGVHSDSPV